MSHLHTVNGNIFTKEQYRFKVRLLQGEAMRISESLVGSRCGAVEQRAHTALGDRANPGTIFPKFSCLCKVCTFITPPRAQLLSPGWHQLFVLDGPTPDRLQYTSRIRYWLVTSPPHYWTSVQRDDCRHKVISTVIRGPTTSRLASWSDPLPTCHSRRGAHSSPTS
jgi:hypothetical protein